MKKKKPGVLPGLGLFDFAPIGVGVYVVDGVVWVLPNMGGFLGCLSLGHDLGLIVFKAIAVTARLTIPAICAFRLGEHKVAGRNQPGLTLRPAVWADNALVLALFIVGNDVLVDLAALLAFKFVAWHY